MVLRWLDTVAERLYELLLLGAYFSTVMSNSIVAPFKHQQFHIPHMNFLPVLV